jgi:hypothetical protein
MEHLRPLAGAAAATRRRLLVPRANHEEDLSKRADGVGWGKRSHHCAADPHTAIGSGL